MRSSIHYAKREIMTAPHNPGTFLLFLNFLTTFHPQVDTSEILKHAGLTEDNLRRSDYRITQEQGERFREKIIELTNNPTKVHQGADYYRKTLGELRTLDAHILQSQKMEAIGTLAGGIAHDFNNILSAIIGFSELAISQVEPDHHVIRCLNRVLQAGNRAKDLVRQILAFSRQSGEEFKPLNLTPIVKETAKLMQASLPSSIRIKIDIDCTVDTIFADATQIHQVLLNLCTNAAHAMSGIHGTLTIRMRNLELPKVEDTHKSHFKGGTYVDLAVSDTGHGIPREIMSRIFDPFFTTKPAGEGTGLGLALVHGIVKNHHGAVTVTSTPHKETTFRILLPVTTPGAESSDMSSPNVYAGGSERILVVDDEEPIVKLHESILAPLGYSVRGFTDAEEALQVFLEEPNAFDLVITDMTMPFLTGSEFASEILSVRSDIPIILSSGFMDSLEAMIPGKQSYSGFLMKPVSRQKLSTTIRRVLDSSLGAS